MTFITQTKSSLIVDFNSSNGSRNLIGAGISFIDSDTAQATEADSITLAVIDHDGNQQYLLTTVSTPAIELSEPSNVYSVDSIPISGFPDGYITLQWTGSIDGYDYVGTQFVEFNNVPAMLFVAGVADTIQDYSFIIDQPKTITIRTLDSIGNPVSESAVRFVILDRNGVSTPVETFTADLIADGIWQKAITLATGTYSAELERYEFYAEIQLVDAGSWFEVQNSRVMISVYNPTSDVTVGPMTYNSNASLRLAFPGIDSLLADVLPNQGEREAWLNQNRIEASAILHEQVKNSRSRAKRPLLEQLANYMTYRIILVKAESFGRFGVPNTQLKEIDKQIRRLYNAVFGSISMIRVGGRV